MATTSTTKIQPTLMARLGEARERTDELFRLLRPEAYFDRPIPERHRNIFYLGHLEAFDWNLLSERALGLKSFKPEFDQLFAFGIDPVGGSLPSDRAKDWPPVEKIRRYNRRVRHELDAALERVWASLSSDLAASLEQLLNVAIEHRLMHAETFAYMLHRLPVSRKISQPAPPAAPSKPIMPRMVEIPAGEATLGLGAKGPEHFGWDNEFKPHRVKVPAFCIDVYPVTNGEFLKFINAGGYENQSLWAEEAWQWVTSCEVRHPAFWVWSGASWHYRTMFGEVPLPLDWPVYVSHAEAAAYARWTEKDLPTEAEWHRAALGTTAEHERPYPWGSQPPARAFGNFDFHRWDPVSVTAHPAGASAFGVMDLVGNGWEWTSTIFSPFPGFEPFPFYPGYSANFFDGRHYVLKGGSARTAACMLRRSFRNWFQPHYPYVYAKFRCVVR
jgi:ergothioneine biosynthesis protein EgtB